MAEQNPFIIDDEDDVIQIHDEEEVEGEVAEVIDITENDIELSEPDGAFRSGPKEETLPSFSLRDQGFIVRPGMTVELKAPIGRFAISFVRVNSIVRLRQAHVNNVSIRGHGFTRAKEMNGMLPKQLNECCLVASVDTRDPRPWREQAILDINPENVLTTRELRVTNAPFPRYRDGSADMAIKRQQVKDMGILVSRYSYVEYHQTEKPREWSFLRVEEKEADEGFRLSDDVLVNGWRGSKVPGGSFLPAGQEHGHGHVHNVDDLTSTLPSRGPKQVPSDQKYTAGDTFAGAGGASRGITDAGVHLEFCVDNWEHAVASLNANFQGQDTTIYDIDMHNFIVDKEIRHRVDILHLSPPCQVWSPAHTRPGQNDEKNLAILFSCTHLIEKIRPRLFTVEQTFGILHPRFDNFFQSLVHGFTDHGYSVRWKVVNFSHYGLPQPRRRLIMIGAGPGEKLPPFPSPTHGNGLKPATTARQALAAIDERRRYPLHQPYLQPFPTRKAPWDGDKPLPYTVTCGAAENYHWSGLRQFTPQEYALLQGFPMHHKFAGSYIKKQIGNAFPPIFVKLLYKHLVVCLDKRDNIIRQAQARTEEAPFQTPRKLGNVGRNEEDDGEVTFLSSRKRRRQFAVVELIDNNNSNSSRSKRARLVGNTSPCQQPAAAQAKQKTVIDLDEDISNLDLDQDRDDGRSDTATIRESSVEVDSPRVSPVRRHPAPPSHLLGPGPNPIRGGPSTCTRTGSKASSSQQQTHNMQGETVRRKLFFTAPPPRTEPFSSPSSTSSTSATTTSSAESSNGSSSSSPVVKKENQKGTRKEPMELFDDD
ncbi:RIP defective [Neurospora tetrasperma FGSC 2508]|uniref:DNA (cytosine-5-)-methyltransferase n=1 Tax=Neurospora tetrasperma (strain FGSC 2508 / ATCC MYA-4615 / P0657) TaxID=510951 RepID=F8N3B0_NEUT8|nr:RIP defective [Neurospora tetrasperma FGSC 2508]EGO51717.1 RIP defective [Neurospora tetrasperma FGSC 2508]EGZ78284.1 RIP defective [Neurospora tetrasperma FGSC 2509]